VRNEWVRSKFQTIVFAVISLWGKFGGPCACGATFWYYLALPNSFLKSFDFKKFVAKEGLKKDNLSGLGAGGPEFKSRRPDHLTPEFSMHCCYCCLRRSLNLGPFGSKYKSLNAFYCATLLFRDRVQINLARDFRRGVPEERLHRS